MEGVTLPGAWAIAGYYGYDLPTEAEWEKAARGPNHLDAGELEPYPWGTNVNDGGNNVNELGYGLIGMVGFQAAEYTRTIPRALKDYPNPEDLTSDYHKVC